jgi:hypothetical protein
MLATMSDATRRAFLAGTKSASVAQPEVRTAAANQAGISRGSIGNVTAKVSAGLSLPVALAMIGIFWASMAYGSD